MKDDAYFLVGQKAFVRKGDEVLIINDPEEGLDYPGGKIQEGEEDIIESLKREVKEETGLEVAVGEPFVTWTSVFPPQHRYAGKRVYLVGYRCEYVSGNIQLSDEHDRFTWVNRENYHDVDDGTSYFDILEKYFV